MTHKERIDLFDEVFQKLRVTLVSKGADYANDGDSLSTFNELATMAKTLKIDTTTPHGCCMFMVLLKMSRISNLVSSMKTPLNESLEDSCLDLLGYSFLLRCTLNQ